MSLSISNIRKATFTEWDYLYQNSNTATYFHSREWAEVWARYSEGKMQPHPLAVEFSDNKKALLPLSLKKATRGLPSHYYSSAAGTFGGWINIDDLTLPHAILLMNYFNSKIGNIILRTNPYDKFMIEAARGIGKEDQTHVLDLQGGYDAILKIWDGGKRSIIRKANKANRSGVVIKQANKVQEWESFYSCYNASLKRWGPDASSNYEWRLFDVLFRQNSKNIKLWLACYDGNVISGALCVYSKRHAAYWLGASLAEYFNLRATNLLMVEIIKNACADNYAWFDFNPSGGHQGVRKFKESFKAQPMSCQIIVNTTTVSRLLAYFKKILLQRQSV